MGAPVGNQYAKRAAKWRDAIERALSAKDGPNQGSTLFRIAEGLIEKAIGGDKDALTEIANRLDGKPAQALEVSGPNGEPVKTVNRVELVDLGTGSTSEET